MSFSIISALTVLLTLGQIFIRDGDFVKHYTPEQKQEVIQLLRESCQMFMEDENIKPMNIPIIVQVMKNGLERFEKKKKEAVEAHCEKLRNEALASSTEGASGEALVCDEEEALLAFEAEHAAEFENMSRELQIFQGFDIRDALQLYGALCVPPYNEPLPAVVEIDEVINMYNRLAGEALATDLSQFHNFQLPQSNFIYAADGKTVIGEIFGQEGRRTWVPLDRIPPLLRQAFISAEDKSFKTHVGIDRGGILRGFVKYMQSRKIEGGSTITQQVVKNTLVGSEVSLDRKVKEMILAVRLEDELKNKDKILEIYLNLIFLGRNSWGVQMASQNYFGMSQKVEDLDLGRMSFLAGVTHSPNRYEPDRGIDNIRERQSYVLGRLVEDGHISQKQMDTALVSDLGFIEKQPIKTSYFQHAVKADVSERISPNSAGGRGAVYHATQIPQIQTAAESSLQDHLAHYEMSHNDVNWTGPLKNLLGVEGQNPISQESVDLVPEYWSPKLRQIQAQYQDIHWDVAVVLANSRDGGVQIGLNSKDGPIVSSLAIADVGNSWAAEVRPLLKVGDVVFAVPYKERYALRVPPEVQGAVVVLEAASGKVLALTGGFSIHFTEYNRGLNALRQPGSTVKPFTYLAALQSGFQPDTLVPNEPIYFPKVDRRCRAWRPRNYSDSGPSQMSLRNGLETSSNRVTARLLQAINPMDHIASLNQVRQITQDFGLYDNPYDCFPFILGSDETSLVKMTAAYAAIANGGTYYEPHFLDESKHAKNLIREPEIRNIKTADKVALFQLKHLLAGVVKDGTAKNLASLNGSDGRSLLGAKTGTSSDYNDAWFVGFSDKVVVGVWVGYDQRQSLKGTGGSLAAPIAKRVFEKAFESFPPEDLLANRPSGVELIQIDGQLESFRRSAPSTKNWVLYGYTPQNPPPRGNIFGGGIGAAPTTKKSPPQPKKPEPAEPREYSLPKPSVDIFNRGNKL